MRNGAAHGDGQNDSQQRRPDRRAHQDSLSHSPSCLFRITLGVSGEKHRAPDHSVKDLHVPRGRYARRGGRVTSTPLREPFSVRRLGVPARPSLAFLAAGAVAIGVYFLLPADAQDVLYVVIGLASVAAVLYGTRELDRGRLAWRCFAAGLL